MSGKIKKIDSIKNMAVFQDFHWESAVIGEGNNVVEFKKINIFYGRNYSGKTTLSRIFRAMKTGSISDKYDAPEFQLSFDGGITVTQNSLTGHGQIVRVFNEDFVKENLRFTKRRNYYLLRTAYCPEPHRAGTFRREMARYLQSQKG